MTNIEFFENEIGIISFKIKGHSHSAQYGYDIVCASISSTSLMTINAFIEVFKFDKLIYKIKDGYMLCDLSELNKDDLIKSQDFLKSLKIFLIQIAKDYPKNAQFRSRRYGK